MYTSRSKKVLFKPFCKKKFAKLKLRYHHGLNLLPHYGLNLVHQLKAY